MNPRTGPNPDRPARGRRLAAIVAALALAWGGAAGASVSTEGTKPGHHCACAERCKGASCCCPSDSHEARPEPAPEARAEKPAPVAPASEGPCVESAPCGHPDLPGPGASRPIVRLAALTPGPVTMAVASMRLRATSDVAGTPSAFVSRIDDPPEA